MWTKQQYKAAYNQACSNCKKWLHGPWWFQGEDQVAKFTGWVAAYTAVLVIVAGLQTCVLSNQLGEMRDEKRPWVGLDSIRNEPFVESHDLRIEIIIKNTGHSPAFDLKGTFIPFGPPVANGTKLEVAPCADNCATGVLWPNGTSMYVVLVPAEKMTLAAINMITKRETSIIIIGRLDYRDSSQKSHKTIICSSYAAAPLNAFIFCNGGTEAD